MSRLLDCIKSCNYNKINFNIKQNKKVIINKNNKDQELEKVVQKFMNIQKKQMNIYIFFSIYFK